MSDTKHTTIVIVNKPMQKFRLFLPTSDTAYLNKRLTLALLVGQRRTCNEIVYHLDEFLFIRNEVVKEMSNKQTNMGFFSYCSTEAAHSFILRVIGHPFPYTEDT